MPASLPTEEDRPWKDRRNRIAALLERVLDLGERLLSRSAAEPLAAAEFESHLAFRFVGGAGGGRLIPIPHPHLFDLDDLVGVERSVAKLVQNARQLVRGAPANHVLLYGERGTGKSSAVKGLLARFGGQGLRIVEVGKADLAHLPDILDALRGAPQRFFLFCDDLSFDLGESGYRELKAALEGSLVAPPDNVRIIATSNRRHLLPQTRAENREVHLDDDGELHIGEALEEKLALADRFGLVLGFFSFDQKTYLRIVDLYAERAGVDAPRESIHAEARRWALDRSSRSGRTAKQFMDDFAGREALRGEE